MLKNRSLSLFVMALCSVLLLNGCWKKKETAMQVMPKPHVTVERASYKPYMEKFNFPGRVEAVNIVTLKARVAGVGAADGQKAVPVLPELSEGRVELRVGPEGVE